MNFATIRPMFDGHLKQSQVDGLNTILEVAKGLDKTWQAYMLATAFRETAATMEPVRESFWLSENWRMSHLRYYPWYGRGYVQLTWEENYKKADATLGLGGKLLATPDLAMQPDIAAQIMLRGMTEGWFTGRKLSDYLPGDYLHARQIINGMDHAHEIADNAKIFEAALA